MKAHPGKDMPCPWCGEPTTRFNDEETGLWIYLEPNALPITQSLGHPCLRHRVYELHESIGWHRKPNYAPRTWREVREIHDCPLMPRQRRTLGEQE